MPGATSTWPTRSSSRPGWERRDPGERELLAGLIKLAAAFVHAARGNPAGAATNLRGARVRLAGAAAAGHGGGFDIRGAAGGDRRPAGAAGCRVDGCSHWPTRCRRAGPRPAARRRRAAGPGPSATTRPRTPDPRTEDARLTFRDRPQIPTIDVRSGQAADGPAADGRGDAGAGRGGAPGARRPGRPAPGRRPRAPRVRRGPGTRCGPLPDLVVPPALRGAAAGSAAPRDLQTAGAGPRP